MRVFLLRKKTFTLALLSEHKLTYAFFLVVDSVFIERTIQHELVVTFGISGSINYRAYDVTTPPQESDRSFNFTQRPPVLTYSAYGDMGDQASLKFGQYRAVTEGLRDVTTFVGDCKFSSL